MSEQSLPESAVEVLLIVEAEDPSDDTGMLLNLNGRDWTVKPITEGHNDGEIAIDFICVSYIWGPDRTSNPLTIGPKNISTNTIPALLAAMQATDVTAFWIDAFCIPTTQPSRAATLESMGYIYSLATQVRAVLSESSFHAVEQLSTTDRLSDEAMATLDADQWIQSVWTYQEVVNCRQLAFVCTVALGSVVEGSHFLNGIGYSVSQYMKRNSIDDHIFRKRFPSLDAFQDLIADWMLAGVQERAALVVMSNMDRRTWTEEQNYFYSMIGAISTAARRRSDIRERHLAETFMEVCERKGDFSFIYSAASRSTGSSQPWKPRVGLLPSVLSTHCYGELQPGHFDESGSLWLEQVQVYRTAPLSQEAKDYISRWLQRNDLAKADEQKIAQAVYQALTGMDFKGNETAIPSTNGLFFPQISLSTIRTIDVKVTVSSTVRFTFGAPGIASYPGESGATCFVPGVFAGLVYGIPTTSTKLA
nr:hypothetical protein CFP56_13225 [Quercus suber]